MARKRAYRIAVAQLRVDADDMELNACGILEALDLAAGEGADFLVICGFSSWHFSMTAICWRTSLGLTTSAARAVSVLYSAR